VSNSTAVVTTYEFTEGTSNKFWRAIYIDDNRAATHWGRIGAKGQCQWTDRGVAAKREGEKRNKGYRMSGRETISVPGNLVNNAKVDPLIDYVSDVVAGKLDPWPDPQRDPEHVEATPVQEDPLVVLATRANAALSLAALQPHEAMVEYASITSQIDEHRDALKLAESNLRTLEMMLGFDDGENV
jgi:predicted DNA-binding WGR domain protein